jgi:hypothetical protein
MGRERLAKTLIPKQPSNRHRLCSHSTHFDSPVPFPQSIFFITRMATTDEDEWEYEYDDNETEDFYVPIDLAHVPELQKPINAVPKVGHPVLLKSRLRAQNERREAEGSISNLSISENTTSLGQIQLNGLHTANPLVMYNGQLLSCEWARNVGTDMFFAKPDLESDKDKALRSLPGVDLIATGSTKLVANVARLRPRDDLFDGTTDDEQIEQPTDTLELNQSAEEGQMPPASSSFLARLNAAKAKRGEKSRLVVAKEAGRIHLAAEMRPQGPVSSAEESAEEEGENVVMAET